MSLENEINEIIAEVLKVDPADIAAEKSFIEDLNADSLDLTELMMSLEEKFDCDIPEEEAEKLRTVGDVMEYIKSKTA